MTILLICSIWALVNTWITLFVATYDAKIDREDLLAIFVCSIFSCPFFFFLKCIVNYTKKVKKRCKKR